MIEGQALLKGFYFVSCGLAILFICHLYKHYQDLAQFKSQIIEQSQKHLEQSAAKEDEIKNTILQAHKRALIASDNINNHFNALLSERERVHGITPNSAKQVPSITTTTPRVSTAQNDKSLKASRELSKKLLKCESRLLYEAKEYDILATHYNELLKIYEQARLAYGSKEETIKD